MTAASLDFLTPQFFAGDRSFFDRTRHFVNQISDTVKSDGKARLLEMLTRACEAVVHNADETAMPYVDGLARHYGFPRQIIQGCQSTPLLYRWKLHINGDFMVYLHRFGRSDEDRQLHDHPFSFVSLILKHGYHEVRPIAPLRERLAVGDKSFDLDDPQVQERAYYAPGSMLFRPSWYAHRVELEKTLPSWSLVVRTRKANDWGFFTHDGWKLWSEWHSAKICDEPEDTK